MKSEHVKKHRLAIVAHLMSEALDDIQQQCGELSPKAIELKENCAKIVPAVEEILTEVYQVNQIHSSTYLTDLANKVETLIRKNYVNITH